MKRRSSSAPLISLTDMHENLRDKWIEMAIREVWTECQFAQVSLSNIDLKAAPNTDVVFTSIHSFLSHCANASKLLDAKEWPDEALKNSRVGSLINTVLRALGFKRGRGGKTIGEILGVSKTLVIHKRRWFRNSLEHYDERLWTWLKTYGPDVLIFDYNVMPKSAVKVAPASKHIWVRNYDPVSNTFTFTDKDLDLSEMSKEVLDIQQIADQWVKNNCPARHRI